MCWTDAEVPSAIFNEHASVTAPVGQHFQECSSLAEDLLANIKIVYTTRTLSFFEASHFAKLKVAPKSWEEFRQRHLAFDGLLVYRIFTALNSVQFFNAFSIPLSMV